MNLQDQTAIVTGGAVRLGRAIALSLAEEGMRICLHYSHSQAEAEQTLLELQGLGADAALVRADFTNPVQAARQVVGFARERFGDVAVLVNSAAIFEPGSVATIDESHWDRHFDINLKAPFFLSQQFALHGASESLRDRAIVNIADWRGSVPVPGHLAYTMTKAALIAQTRLLAQELGPGIRVNAVAPGAILPATGTDPQTFNARGAFNPLRKTGSPDDLCDAVRLLLKAEFISGEVLHVTGGEQLAPGTRYH
jgi:NAD(P)-dependent dehydrogenase (short-subunit alcohol dehydrogenase family)